MQIEAYSGQEPGHYLLRSKAPASSTGGKWVWIATEGSWKGYDDGEFTLTREAFQNAVDVFEANGIELALNFDHERREAAGWYMALQIRDGKDGKAELWGKLKLTPAGRKAIADETFKYTSIEFDVNAVDEITGQKIGPRLIGVALTNYPFIKGQKPLKASENNRGFDMTDQSQTAAPAQGELPIAAQEIDEAKAAAGLEALALLRTILGVGEDVDDAQVLAMVQEQLDALQEAVGGAPAEGTPAEAEPAPASEAAAAESIPSQPITASELKRTVRLQEQTIKRLGEQVKLLMSERQQERHQDIEDKVDGYITTGVLLDTQREDMVWLAEHSPERFERIVGALPEPKKERTLAEPKRARDNAPADIQLSELDAAQREYAERMIKFSRGAIPLNVAIERAKERAHLWQ